MALYEIVKADGAREKVQAYDGVCSEGSLLFYASNAEITHRYRKGTWLEVWRREGVSE